MIDQRRNIITVGVQCFVLSDSRLLLGRRTAGFGTGSWGLPGGHLEQGETILEAGARELKEETGLIAKTMRIVVIGDPIKENHFHLQIGVLVDKWSGEPEVVAPDELGELQFFPLDKLPVNLLISSEYIIEKFRNNRLY
jgi:8-oxo-dGTP diphosphatase